MKSLKIVLGVLLGCIIGGSEIQGQTSLSLSPIKFDLKIKAGKSEKCTFLVGNDTYNSVRIQAGVENWTIGDAGLDVFPAPGASDLLCRDWITLDNPELVLKSGDRREVAAKISVPSTAESGQYLAAISFKSLAGEASKDRSGLSIQGQLIAVIFVMVGNPPEEGSLADLTFEKKGGRKALMVRVKNSGRTFLKTSGRVDLRNAKGKKVFASELLEDLIPPLSERLLPVVLGKEIPPGEYQVGCVLSIPSHKSMQMKRTVVIE